MITLSIIIFVVCLVVITAIKPRVMYNDDGSLRDFGVGYRKKTVLPLWLVVILLAIMAYFVTTVLSRRHVLGKVGW